MLRTSSMWLVRILLNNYLMNKLVKDTKDKIFALLHEGLV